VCVCVCVCVCLDTQTEGETNSALGGCDIYRVGQNHIWGIYGILRKEITKNTVIYGAYIRFWPTLDIYYKP